MTYRVSLAEPLLAHRAGAGAVLGLDTGTGIASLGLVAQGRIVASLTRPAASHGADLPALVAELMSLAGLEFRELSAVAVGIGPGSFTGLRIGLSYAKGVAMGSGIAIVGVPSLDAMALCAQASVAPRPGLKICPIIDARRGEIYASLYQVVGDALENDVGSLVVPLNDFAARITGDVAFIGESKAEEACAIVNANGGRATHAGVAELRHRGSFVAALGAQRIVQHDVDQAATLEPLYVRALEASLKSTAVNPKEGTHHGTPRGRVDSAACRS
jgi:tRNA threonylcarbamoyladenosine biosynthesis protein TsaB